MGSIRWHSWQTELAPLSTQCLCAGQIRQVRTKLIILLGGFQHHCPDNDNSIKDTFVIKSCTLLKPRTPIIDKVA